MQITIDIESPEAPFAQLIDQIKGAVQAGFIKPGDALPSIRQLASDLELNSKTVAKAYKTLERDSIIQTRGYRGTFVHADAVKNSSRDLPSWVQERLSEVVAACRTAGATDSEIRIAFGHVMQARPNGTP